MGTYSVWVLTEQKSPEEEILSTIEPYCEENNIPGPWPGMSFDHCEYQKTENAGRMAQVIDEQGPSAAPTALIYPEGQMRNAQEALDSFGMPPLRRGGHLEMMAELEKRHNWCCHIMSWHC